MSLWKLELEAVGAVDFGNISWSLNCGNHWVCLDQISTEEIWVWPREGQIRPGLDEPELLMVIWEHMETTSASLTSSSEICETWGRHAVLSVQSCTDTFSRSWWSLRSWSSGNWNNGEVRFWDRKSNPASLLKKKAPSWLSFKYHLPLRARTNPEP